MITFEDLLADFLKDGSSGGVAAPRPMSPISPITPSPIGGIGEAVGGVVKDQLESELQRATLDAFSSQGATGAYAPYGYLTNSAGEAIGTAGAPYGYLTNGAGEAIGTSAGTSLSGTAAAPPPAYGASALSTFSNFGVPVVGSLLLNDLLTHQRGEVRGAAQGAAGGAAVGSAILPGVGTAIGATLGGLYGGLTGHKPKTQQEEGRWQKLVEEGKVDPRHFRERETITNNEKFDKDFQGIDPETGQYVNNRFANTRDERYLTKQDAPKYRWGAVWRERYNDFDTFNEKAQDAIIGYALDNNLMYEKYGSLNVRTTPEFEGYADQMATLERERIATEKQKYKDALPRTASQWL